MQTKQGVGVGVCGYRGYKIQSMFLKQQSQAKLFSFQKRKRQLLKQFQLISATADVYQLSTEHHPSPQPHSHPFSQPLHTAWTKVKNLIKNQIQSPFDGEITKLLLPTLAMYLLDPMMNLVDIGIVARMGTAPLAGVGMAATQVFFVSSLFSFLNVLTVPPAAQAYLNGEIDELSKVVAKGMWIAVVSGIILGVLVYTFSPYYVAWMKPSDEVGFYAMEFIRARAVGIPLVTLSFVFTGVYRGCQDTLSPLIAQFGAIAANLICDILFVLVWGWGVAGSAWATVLSYAVSDTWLLIVLIKQKGIKFKKLLIPPKINEVITMLVQGAALSTRTLTYMAFVTVSQRSVARLGPSAQAAQEVIRQLFVIFSLPQWALHATSVTIVSKYLGLQKRILARDAFFRCLTIAMVTSIIMGLLMVFFQSPIILQFTQDPRVIGHIGVGITIIACLLWLDGMASVTEGALQANSQTKEIAQVGIFSMLAVTCMMYVVDQFNLVSVAFIWASVRINSLLRVVVGWKQVFFNQPDFKREEDLEQLELKDQEMEKKIEGENSQGGEEEKQILTLFDQQDDSINQLKIIDGLDESDDQKEEVLLSSRQCEPPCTQQS
eukprot:TRINITY_DN28060_c0_g2_i8.p1 TRINITY_DN28060_c0_g2~~TRINITY_DN28060_c0_g2_i8.p1  ORF type:complete len:604 (-),score=62.71 TRINITY_DN28060_c0_g2_i8:211-2022(-)